MNTREKFDIDIPAETLSSSASFKEMMDDMKHRFDVYIKDEKNDEEISKLRKIIANAIVAKLYEQFPDGSEDTAYPFDGAESCSSRQIKHTLLTEAVKHDMFLPRKHQQFYGWLNTAASLYSRTSNNDISAVLTASQEILYKVLQANQVLMNAVPSAQYQVEAYKRESFPALNK